jgi:hypothetical protein
MMAKFSIDYQELSNSVSHAHKEVFKLSDVEHRLEKVAFDVVRFKDGKPDELWQIQNSDDGDYIVARYESDEPKVEAKTASGWDTLVGESSGDINIFYKGQPITKMAASKLGISSEDLNTVKRFLPAKLASDKSFVKALLTTLDEASRDAILKLYPELS